MIKQVYRNFAGRMKLAVPVVILSVALIGSQAIAQDSVPSGAKTGYDAIDAGDLEAILTFLASDELEGRGTTQRGLKIAAKFLESQYTLAGLTPVPGQTSMLQPFTVLVSKLEPSTSISVNVMKNGASISRDYTLYNDFYVRASGQSYDIQGNVAFVGFGAQDDAAKYDDYKGIDIRGKVLLVLGGRPDFLASEGGRGRRGPDMSAAEEGGAVAVLTVSTRPLAAQMARYRRYLDRPSYTLEDSDRGLPSATISKKLADAILANSGHTVESLTKKINNTKKPSSFQVTNVSVMLDVNLESEAKQTQNVVAYLEGSDPQLKQEVVAFGAHYDHLGITEDGTIYNGADDDGSGTTGILEIARAYAANPERPKRSLLFVSHAGEEKGLLGSRYYTDNPLISLENTVAQLNVDMVGRNEDNSVYIIGSDFISTELHELNIEANRVVGMTLDYKYNSPDHPERFYFRSDHYNYAKHDIPIIFYFTGTHEDYHQETDDVEKIKFDKIERIAKLIYLTGWHVANLDHRLSKDGKMMMTH